MGGGIAPAEGVGGEGGAPELPGGWLLRMLAEVEAKAPLLAFGTLPFPVNRIAALLRNREPAPEAVARQLRRL